MERQLVSVSVTARKNLLYRQSIVILDTAGEDYTSVTTTVMFLAGTTEAFVPVDLLMDDLDEPVENFFAVLSNPSEGLTLATGEVTMDTATIDIIDINGWFRLLIH